MTCPHRERPASGARHDGVDEQLVRERMLRPGQTLADVIEQDRASLAALGVTHSRIADRLGNIVSARLDADRARRDAWRQALDRLAVSHPDIDPGQRADMASADPQVIAAAGPDAGQDLHARVRTWRGAKTCPLCGSRDRGHIDVTLTRADGRTLKFGGLLIHLIAEHEFFEGPGIPYRLDPVQAADFLDLPVTDGIASRDPRT